MTRASPATPVTGIGPTAGPDQTKVEGLRLAVRLLVVLLQLLRVVRVPKLLRELVLVVGVPKLFREVVLVELLGEDLLGLGDRLGLDGVAEAAEDPVGFGAEGVVVDEVGPGRR